MPGAGERLGEHLAYFQRAARGAGENQIGIKPPHLGMLTHPFCRKAHQRG